VISLSKVILKMSFKHPNLKDSISKNMSHVEYIGTRSGVDKSITENDLKKELEKGISDDETYANYINERPRSHGLFGKDGIEDINEVKKELSSNAGFVWRAIISLKEDDAIKNGFDSKEKWQELIRLKMPDIAYEMGIKLDNLRWCAAVHMEKGHPHTHVMFWEKNPERIIGAVKESTLNSIRKSLTDQVFENERQVLLTEKNMMRDLLRDLAVKNIGDIVKEIKEVNEIDVLTGKADKNELAPKLFPDEEKKLMNDIKELSQILPNNGRIAFKFMPEDVKIKVKEIAEYILKQPVFADAVEKNLKSTEELTKMYTGKDEDIEKSKDKAYSDLVKRISQVILRGAVEVTKENKLIVDTDRANVAVNLIKESKGSIENSQDLRDLCSNLSKYCLKVNISDEESIDAIFKYLNKEGCIYSYEDVKQIFEEVKENYKDFDLSDKEINNCLIVLKSLGIDENRSMQLLRKSASEMKHLEHLINKYEKEGFVNKNKGSFVLSEKGYNLLSRTNYLSKLQKEIIKFTKDETDIDKLLSNKLLINEVAMVKDSDYIKLSKFDYKIREEFGDNNLINMKDFETKMMSQYKNDIERADKEFNYFKSRIFTRYDANVTLKYITDDGLDGDELKGILLQEMQNRVALSLHEDINSILQREDIKKYINVDENGNICATQEGIKIEKELNIVNQFINKGPISIEDVKDICERKYGANSKSKYESISNKLEDLFKKGYLNKTKDNKYVIEDHIKTLRSLLKQLKIENGVINEKNLLNVLEKNIPSKDAENQCNYLLKRMDNLTKEGYLKKEDGKYYITQKGINKKDEVLHPEKEVLLKNIDYLKKLGIIKETPTGLKSIKVDRVKIEDENLKKILIIANKGYGAIEIDKIKKSNIKLINSKYLNDTYEEIKTNIDEVRKNLKVGNTPEKTITTLAKTLLVSGVEYEEVKTILNKFSDYVGKDNYENIIEKVYKEVTENNAFGKLSVISKDDWSNMFRSIGINPPPDYMYKGLYSMNNSLGLASIVNQIWKAAWKNLEYQKNKTVMQAEYMKKQLLKDGAKSKEAIKEEFKKQRSSSLFKDEELENS